MDGTPSTKTTTFSPSARLSLSIPIAPLYIPSMLCHHAIE
jgi:hypothetical protein